MVSRLCGAIAGILLLGGSSALAAHAPAEVALDRTAVQPGETAKLAIVFKIDPGWHLYWTNPGAAGAPPKVKWSLPKGVTVSDLQFPVPERKRIGDLTAFVYENEVALLADVTLPADASGAVELKGHIKAVVCEDVCLLEEQDIALRIPVGPGQPNAADRFKTWRSAQPARPSPPRAVAATIEPERQRGAFTIDLPSARGVNELFPPRSRFLQFEDRGHFSPGDATHPPTYKIGFRILPDPPTEFSGPGIVVVLDPSGKTSAEELSFTFKFAKPD